MSDTNSSGTAIVSIFAIIAILVVGYFMIQMMQSEKNDEGITIELPTGSESDNK